MAKTDEIVNLISALIVVTEQAERHNVMHMESSTSLWKLLFASLASVIIPLKRLAPLPSPVGSTIAKTLFAANPIGIAFAGYLLGTRSALALLRTILAAPQSNLSFLEFSRFAAVSAWFRDPAKLAFASIPAFLATVHFVFSGWSYNVYLLAVRTFLANALDSFGVCFVSFFRFEDICALLGARLAPPMMVCGFVLRIAHRAYSGVPSLFTFLSRVKSGLAAAAAKSRSACSTLEFMKIRLSAMLADTFVLCHVSTLHSIKNPLLQFGPVAGVESTQVLQQGIK